MEAIQVTKTQRFQTGFTDVNQIRFPPGWNNETEAVKPVEKIPQTDSHKSDLQNSEEQTRPLSVLISGLEKNLLKMNQVGLKFSQHKESGRMMIRVVEAGTDKVIREIPPESFLDLVVKMEQMIGLLYDQRV
ncbi:MAG: flagellar protein FlaG [Desulfatirhabdiaceae bacterium]